MSRYANTMATFALPLLLQLAGLSLAVGINPYINRRHKRFMLLIEALLLSLILQNLADYQLQNDPAHIPWRLMNSVYGYSIRPAILVLFLCVVQPDKRHLPSWALVGINAAVFQTAFFSKLTFYYDAQNHFHRGPLGYTCHIVSVFLIAWLLMQTLAEYRHQRRFENTLPILSALLIVASVIADIALDYLPPLSYLTIASVNACMFVYSWLHLQFFRRHEQALLAEQRIQIMISQIQPHFLYNTLSTIQALCRIDPEKAFDTVEKFGTYLRQNIDSLNQTSLIPFSKELEHTRVYAEIEMLRFPSIQIEYAVEDEDFALPALTLQPLVENAIRHGVRIRDHGLVSVAARREADAHVIVIRDNGQGFDPNAPAKSGESHIGLRNVRERLEKLCGGTMTIESTIGTGTTITLRLPIAHDSPNSAKGGKRP